jgi:SAM-dependent methyltransferase
MSDVWAVGDAYEPYIGRWSRLVAPPFLDWLAVGPGRRWLDVGCGTGALAHAIARRCAPAEVVGIDASEGFLGWAAAQAPDGPVRFEVGDAADLSGRHADVVVSGLMLNFLPDPAAAVAAMARAVPAGSGVVGAYLWDYAEGMEMLRRFWDAVVALDPGASGLDEGVRFPLCRTDALGALWRDAALADVTVEGIEVPTVFGSFEDYWAPFLGGQGPAPGYVASLDDAARDRLRDTVHAALPVGPDGSIALSARAWAVRGRAR